MTRFYGKVGFAVTSETKPGIWQEEIVDRYYYGDVTRLSRSLSGTDKVNDDISVSNSISIVADEFAYSHFFCMKYVEWQGVKWKATNVEVQHPRLNISLGGVYNA